MNGKKRNEIMILIGEIEYTNKMMAPADTGFLFVSTENLINDVMSYSYTISPDIRNYHVGQKEIFDKPLSITEYLQYVVNADISISRNASIKFKDGVGIRLKGMTKWITRTDSPSK